MVQWQQSEIFGELRTSPQPLLPALLSPGDQLADGQPPPSYTDLSHRDNPKQTGAQGFIAGAITHTPRRVHFHDDPHLHRHAATQA